MAMKNFFVGVKGVITNEQDEYLLIKDSSKVDFWDFPGGRIDENETIQQALLREMSEEVPSLANPEVGELVHAFRVPGSVKDNLGLLLLFYKVTVNMMPEVIELSHEHTEYGWFSYPDALKIASDGVQSALRSLKIS